MLLAKLALSLLCFVFKVCCCCLCNVFVWLCLLHLDPITNSWSLLSLLYMLLLFEQEQLHEREQSILELERKLEEKDRELRAMKIDTEAVCFSSSLFLLSEKLEFYFEVVFLFRFWLGMG